MKYLKQTEYFMHGASTVLSIWALIEGWKISFNNFSIGVFIFLALATLWFVFHLIITFIVACAELHDFLKENYNRIDWSK